MVPRYDVQSANRVSGVNALGSGQNVVVVDYNPATKVLVAIVKCHDDPYHPGKLVGCSLHPIVDPVRGGI